MEPPIGPPNERHPVTDTPQQGWQLTIATAPWFGWCKGTCDRELGLRKPELVARRTGETRAFSWFCAACVTEVVRADEIRAYEQGRATGRNPHP